MNSIFSLSNCLLKYVDEEDLQQLTTKTHLIWQNIERSHEGRKGYWIGFFTYALLLGISYFANEYLIHIESSITCVSNK